MKVAGLGAGAALLNTCASPLMRTNRDPAGFSSPAPFITPADTPAPRIVTPTPENPGTAGPAPTPGPDVSYEGRKLCFVLWDHQLAQYGFRPRNMKNPVPETVPLYAGVAMLVTPAWQDYWEGLLHLLNPDMGGADFQKSWNSLVASDRAFTNNTGGDTDNFRLHDITCGGATLEMVTGIPEGPKDHQRMRIYTLNMSGNPPPVPATVHEIDMTRHFFATTGSNVRLPDGSYVVNGFPQFENCIIPLISNDDTDLIDVSRIKPVTGLQPPYNTWAGQAPPVGGSRR